MSAARGQDATVPVVVRSPSTVDPAHILTLPEVAERLKVSERWVYEKSRRRCLNPLPCIRIGRYLRFDWASVSSWLRQQERWHERTHSRI
jgi:predicted DNA-binding transcriptional regulator AlpA